MPLGLEERGNTGLAQRHLFGLLLHAQDVSGSERMELDGFPNTGVHRGDSPRSIGCRSPLRAPELDEGAITEC